MKALEKFHHRVSQRIVGKTERHVRVKGWDCPPVEESLEAEVLWPMKDYVRQKQATIDEYITTRLIYEICTGVERLQGTSPMMCIDGN